MGWLEGVWDGNTMLKCQHTYADFPAGKSPNADISAHMLERQHNEYYKLKNCQVAQYVKVPWPALSGIFSKEGT